VELPPRDDTVSEGTDCSTLTKHLRRLACTDLLIRLVETRYCLLLDSNTSYLPPHASLVL
jgi:hypothetical protein